MIDYIKNLYDTLNKYKSKEDSLFNRGILINTQSLIDEYERNEFLNEKAKELVNFYMGFVFSNLPYENRLFAAKKCAINDLNNTINAIYDIGGNAEDFIEIKSLILKENFVINYKQSETKQKTFNH
jgi:hypothetical protein